MDQDFNDVYFPSLEEFQAQAEPASKSAVFDVNDPQSPLIDPFETVAFTLSASTESSDSSSTARRPPMFELQRGDSNFSEIPISRDDDAVVSVKKRR